MDTSGEWDHICNMIKEQLKNVFNNNNSISTYFGIQFRVAFIHE